MQGTSGDIRVGIGGWTYEPWRGQFYPDRLPHRRELEYAAARLTSIEINGTYYGSQKPESFRRWHDETPDGFVFALKAPRFATNRRKLSEAGESIDRFFASGIMRLGPKLGPINWQFATTKAFDREDFAGFFDLLPDRVEGRPIRHAVEVRHDSFRCEHFVTLARERGVAIVVAGDADYPQIADVTAPFVYARIMGTREDEPRGYGADAMRRWASRARQWAGGGRADGLQTILPSDAGDGAGAEARDVYLYVISGHKPHNPAAAMGILEELG